MKKLKSFFLAIGAVGTVVLAGCGNQQIEALESRIEILEREVQELQQDNGKLRQTVNRLGVTVASMDAPENSDRLAHKTQQEVMDQYRAPESPNHDIQDQRAQNKARQAMCKRQCKEARTFCESSMRDPEMNMTKDEMQDKRQECRDEMDKCREACVQKDIE